MQKVSQNYTSPLNKIKHTLLNNSCTRRKLKLFLTIEILSMI